MDPLEWIIKFCRPTTSQEAKLRSCPMARHDEIFADSDSGQVQGPSAGPSAGIIDIPSSGSSLVNNVDDVPDRIERVRVSDDDDAKAKKIRASEEKGKTAVAGETETTSQEAKLRSCPVARHDEIFVDCDSDQVPGPSGRAGIVDIPSTESSGSLVNNVDDVPDGIKRVRVSDDDAKAKKIRDLEEKGETAVAGETEAVEKIGPSKRRRLPASWTLKEEEKEVPNGVDEAGDVKEVKDKSGLLDYLDLLKVIFENTDEDEDFFEMIQRKGFTFDRPRWWPDD